MSIATAQLNNYRQAPRKVRLLANLVRGKKVSQALVTLQFANKKAAEPMRKLIQSAVSNAKSLGLNEVNLVVSKITVDGGAILYRRLPMARGRAFTKRKRTSKVKLELSESVVDQKSVVNQKEATQEKKEKKVKAKEVKK